LPHCPDNFADLKAESCSMAVSEAMLMKRGDLVLAQTFSDGQVRRMVVEKEGDTVYICTEEEWLSAQNESREPLCAGFNKRYIAPVTATRS
jgi:hypothetical protein